MSSDIPFNDENREKMNRVAEALEGRCGSLVTALEEAFGEGDLCAFDIELLRHLDSIVMECEGCGWWCETSEFDGDDQLCEDCRCAD